MWTKAHVFGLDYDELGVVGTEGRPPVAIFSCGVNRLLVVGKFNGSRNALVVLFEEDMEMQVLDVGVGEGGRYDEACAGLVTLEYKSKTPSGGRDALPYRRHQ